MSGRQYKHVRPEPRRNAPGTRENTKPTMTFVRQVSAQKNREAQEITRARGLVAFVYQTKRPGVELEDVRDDEAVRRSRFLTDT